MKKLLMIVAVIVVPLAVCTVGPKYRRPIVEPPAAFRGFSDTAAASDPGSLADLKWFEVFKDDQLQELIRTALVNNYDLRRAVARIQAARANLGITRSDQFPNITAGADVTTLRNSGSGQFVLPGGGEPRPDVRDGVAQSTLLRGRHLGQAASREKGGARQPPRHRRRPQSRHDNGCGRH